MAEKGEGGNRLTCSIAFLTGVPQNIQSLLLGSSAAASPPLSTDKGVDGTPKALRAELGRLMEEKKRVVNMLRTTQVRGSNITGSGKEKGKIGMV